jgi:putative membrane protein
MSDQGNAALHRVLWGVIGLWTLVTLTSFFAPQWLSANNARFINVALLSAFTLIHGARRYGAVGILVYFAIAVVVTNFTENLSILTGFPFGDYHHTANMGPQIFCVPLIVGPIFAVAGYLAWMLAGILLGDVFREGHRGGVARPLLAAFITTSWDLCVDAIGGTLNRDWVWADGGPWFGVPLMNFFGWMLTMWLIFQLFSAWLVRSAAPPRQVPAASRYWDQVVAYWTLIALQFPLLALIVPDMPLTDPTGASWQASDLLQSMALVSVFTMLFTSVLAAALLSRARREGR